MTKYTRLTISERELIMTGLSQGCTLRSIATELGRHVSSVSREVFLNLDDHEAYSAFWAHELGLDYRKGRHTGNKIADNVQLFTFIHKHLKKRWAPQQISKELKKLYPSNRIRSADPY